jgi:hypothetical protein
MEEDGGNTKKIQEAASALLMQSGNPYGVGAGVVIGALTKAGLKIEDPDDMIASFAVTIYNNNGNTTVKWRAVDNFNSELTNVDGRGVDGHEYRYKDNDGRPNYVGWFHFYVEDLNGKRHN